MTLLSKHQRGSFIPFNIQFYTCQFSTMYYNLNRSIMSNTRRSKISLKQIIMAVILLAIIGAIGFFGYKFFVKKTPPESPQSEQGIDSLNQNTQAENIPSQDSTPEKDPQTPVQYEGQDPNALAELSGVVSSARVTGEDLVIRTNIDQFISSGTCELTLTSGDSTLTETADIVAMVSTSACDIFRIPVSKLSSGHWDIKINLSSDGKQGIITGEANI